MVLTPKLIAEYARHVESQDPIEFGSLSLDQDNLFEMIASSMLEQFNGLEPEDRELMLLAVSTKLVVENFVAHARMKIGS